MCYSNELIILSFAWIKQANLLNNIFVLVVIENDKLGIKFHINTTKWILQKPLYRN